MVRPVRSYDYARYLRSKSTVDDRALNKDVLKETFRSELRTASSLNVAELGGGTGTMIDRIIDWNLLEQASYTIVDVDSELLSHTARQIELWKTGQSRTKPNRQSATKIDAKYECQNLLDWLEEEGECYDLIIAHAVLDLVDISDIFPKLFRRLRPNGKIWTTINFDGETILIPTLDHDKDLIDAYHLSMDTRVRYNKRAGSATTGRQIFSQVQRDAGHIYAAGASDWIVYPKDGQYIADEAYFLHHIIHTVEEELKDHEELGQFIPVWGQQRHEQIETGQLCYLAHQYDFLIGPSATKRSPATTRRRDISGHR